MAKAQNYLLMPLHGRFLHSRRILCLIRFYVSWQRSLAALNIKTIRKVKLPMNSQERREARYQRRKAKREQKKLERSLQVGTIEDTLSFSELYKAGKRCCNGVRWKQSLLCGMDESAGRRAWNDQYALYQPNRHPLLRHVYNSGGYPHSLQGYISDQ